MTGPGATVLVLRLRRRGSPSSCVCVASAIVVLASETASTGRLVPGVGGFPGPSRGCEVGGTRYARAWR
jgi:hypothetical protein